MKLPENPSQAQQLIAVGRISGSASMLRLSSGDILFYNEYPVAAREGGFVYVCDGKAASSQTRVINLYAHHAPQIRVAPDQFDFIVGAMLTKSGLPLTQRKE